MTILKKCGIASRYILYFIYITEFVHEICLANVHLRLQNVGVHTCIITNVRYKGRKPTK